MRGYVTKTGTEPDVVPGSFAREIFDACVRTGWVFSDLGRKNVIIIDGRPSLIDFDTHLVTLKGLNIESEEKRGALRPHVSPVFRDLLRQHISDTK